MKRTLATVALLCACVSFPAYSQTFEEATVAFGKKDYVIAAAGFRTAAEQGDSGAQLNLAMMYERGLGVAQDAAMATEWLRKAAEQGVSKAQYKLAMRYYSETGVKRDVQAASHWLLKAADNGFPQAQYDVGLLAWDGNEGFTKNRALAVVMYRNSATQGNPKAQYNLGVLYANGDEVPKDTNQAFSWINKAAAQGFPQAVAALALMQKERTGTPKE